MSVKSAVRVPSWEELNAMSYEELRELYKEHQDVLRKPLAESESVASLHALSLTTGVEIEKDELYSAVRQAITDGSANPSLAKDALLEDPVTFSRVRRFNTGTDLFGRGEFIEQLYVFPNSKVRTFHIISKDPKRAQMIAAKQRMLRKLKDYITSNGATEAKNLLEGLLARDPIYETPTSVHSLFLDATDLKTALRSADLEGRMRTISETTKYDLMLNSYSQRFLETKEGKRAATLGGTWRTLWRGTNLLEEKDESRSLLEEIILPADRTTTEQLRQKGAVDANGRLLNGTPLWLYETPNIAGVLSLLGVRPGKPGLEKAGFSMGDLNPGNVMVYADGRQEFIDHENACLDPATSMLAQRWIRAGVYKENGDAQTVNGVDAEKRLLDESYSHYSGLPGEKLGRGAFESEFRRHKAGFLLRLARRYKKYEEIDTNPVRMGQLKRYYYSWFAKELKNQRKIDGINDHKLDYLNSLFEKPLDDAGMEEVFRNSDPAFSYRSELSPSAMGLKKRMETEVESRYSSYKREEEEEWDSEDCSGRDCRGGDDIIWRFGIQNIQPEQGIQADDREDQSRTQ